jgi:hypothetical protein
VSTDAHGPKHRRPLLRRACERVAELAGHESALELCCRNPAAVAEGRPVAAGRRQVERPRAAGWLSWKKAA